MNVLVVSGGNVDLKILNENYDKIIAVDRGLESLYEINKEPDYIVGDFDSVNKDIINFYKNKNIPIQEHNPEKDFTDTDLGLKFAISLNPTKITIVGGIGTRLDHTIANIHILTLALEKHIECEILDEHNKIYLIDNFTKIEKRKAFGKYVSLIPLTSQVKGITLKGFKYLLDNYTLSIGKSLGISNEIEEEVATIEINDGILIVIESKD